MKTMTWRQIIISAIAGAVWAVVWYLFDWSHPIIIGLFWADKVLLGYKNQNKQDGI